LFYFDRSMARPRKEDARDTRQLILDAALDLFAEQSFAGTSIRQIAQKVGVRESALYHHFPSKEAIFHGLLSTLGPGRATQLMSIDVPAMVEQLGAEGLIRMMVQGITLAWSTAEEQKLARLMLSEGTGLLKGPDTPRMYVKRARANITRIFEELMRLKAIPPATAESYSLLLMGPLIILRLQHLVLPGGEPEFQAFQQGAERHVEFFLKHVLKLNERSHSKRPARGRKAKP
jgi:AcrR family transcriptional regulator